MRLPFVSRLAFDVLQQQLAKAEARAESYYADIVALKQQGFGPRAQASIHNPPPEPEAEVKRKAGVALLAEKIRAERDVSAADALREAERMLALAAPGPFTQGPT